MRAHGRATENHTSQYAESDERDKSVVCSWRCRTREGRATTLALRRDHADPKCKDPKCKDPGFTCKGTRSKDPVFLPVQATYVYSRYDEIATSVQSSTRLRFRWVNGKTKNSLRCCLKAFRRITDILGKRNSCVSLPSTRPRIRSPSDK